MYPETGIVSSICEAVIKNKHKNFRIEASVVNASQGDHAGRLIGVAETVPSFVYKEKQETISFDGVKSRVPEKSIW